MGSTQQLWTQLIGSDNMPPSLAKLADRMEVESVRSAFSDRSKKSRVNTVGGNGGVGSSHHQMTNYGQIVSQSPSTNFMSTTPNGPPNGSIVLTNGHDSPSSLLMSPINGPNSIYGHTIAGKPPRPHQHLHSHHHHHPQQQQQQHHERSSSRHSHRSSRSTNRDIIIGGPGHGYVNKLDSPDERLEVGSSNGHSGHHRPEMIEVQILPQDDNWGDNTTCVTGNTSDHSISMEDMNKVGLGGGKFGSAIDKSQDTGWSEASPGLRCQMWIGTILTAVLSLCAFFSPIVMVIIPKFEPLEWKVQECGPECDGLLISFAFKLFILAIGAWAVFFRRPRATMPRIFIYRSAILALVFIFLVSYWLFFAVRIAERRFADYELSYYSIVVFAISLIDALLFIHYLAVVLIELRHLQPQYILKVLRSPDGESKCYNIGQLSIQRAAVFILDRYYQDFSIYNPYLDTVPSVSSRKSDKGSHRHRHHHHHKAQLSNMLSPGVAGGAFKVYDLDGPLGPQQHQQQQQGGAGGHNSSPMLNINGGSRVNRNGDGSGGDSSGSGLRHRGGRSGSSHHHHHHHTSKSSSSHHNDRFHEEYEYERRVRKRKARLIAATEEAFTHIKRIQDEQGPAIPMDPYEAAQAIFPTLARPLQKYLRVTRQQPRHSMQSILQHLSTCLSYDLSPKAFLEKYLITSPVLQSDAERNSSLKSWGLVCDILVTRSLEPGLTFLLRQGDVSLLCTVSQLPHLNITEQIIDPKSNKFMFKLNSETSV